MPLPSFPFPSRPLKIEPLKPSWRVWGALGLPSRQTIWCILESKSAALVTAVFVDFPENKYANSCLR